MPNQDSEFTKAKKRLASNPESKSETLEKLANKSEVANRVAENSSTSPDTLERLAGHERTKVRLAVAENTNASPEVIASLADDANPDVRFRVAETATTPVDVLERLANDENPFVASRATQTLERLRNEPDLAKQMQNKRATLSEDAWALIAELLRRERGELPTEIHHTQLSEAKDFLKGRLRLVDETLHQLGAHN